MEGIVQAAVSANRLRATQDFAEGIGGTDIALVCVGTPSERNGNSAWSRVLNFQAILGHDASMAALIDNEILTVCEVASELRCSKAHVHNLITGKVPGVPILPALHLGRRRLVRRPARPRGGRESKRLHSRFCRKTKECSRRARICPSSHVRRVLEHLGAGLERNGR